jgi:endo-1,4-beta-xylanase
MHRRGFIAGAGVAGLAALTAREALTQGLRASIDEPSGPGLAARAAKRGVLYGAATANYELAQADFAQAFLREADLLVAEYEMKRDALEPVRGRHDFSAADALAAFAQRHGLKLRGHTLCWYTSLPSWLDASAFATRDETLLTGYIAAIAGRYRGRIHSWDVVNEALLPGDGRSDGLRNSPWLTAFGPSYIDIAYHAARAADPHALLVYNDWGFEAGGADNDRFRHVTLDFLEASLKRGVPIDALGLQGHLGAFGTPVDQKKLAVFLDRVKAMGLKILVTEHDVDDSGGPSDIAARDRAVADASRRFLDVVLANSATEAVLTWGLSDRFLRAEGLRATLTGRRPRMLPLDDDLQRTAMWQAMARTFAG